MRFALAFLLLIISQSCSLINSDIAASQGKPNLKSTTKQVSDTVPGEEQSKYKEGDNLSKFLRTTKVRDRSLKIKNLVDFVDQGKKTVFIAVKPDCVFCETLLATMQDYSSKTKFKQKIVFFTDVKHASVDAFLKKSNEYSQIPATWIYDDQNKLAETFVLSAFPRFLIIDAKHKLVKDQRGLVPPANRESLKGLEIPVILQKISESTIDWLKVQ
jgi:thiol-disulfide isomerase/thioredoxin